MKKDDLVKVIRAIVKQELKKELPIALAQVFQNLMGQQPPMASAFGKPKNYIGQALPKPPSAKEMPDEQPDEFEQAALLKEQLREMFNGDTPVARVQAQPAPQPKRFTNNPLLNEVLNQTRPFNSDERMAMRVGGGVGGTGVAPAVAMAAASFGPIAGPTSMPGVGQMMDSEELGFLNKIPGMPGSDQPMLANLPPGVQPAMEAPSMGQPSALDFKHSDALPETLRNALSRDYRSLVQAMDKGKKK